ncbi:MAG: glutamate-5-semialdehyde dehydrogenase [bacterium]|nr:glutamate-5-semialdehyde dehydrogenase [bacterium]
MADLNKQDILGTLASLLDSERAAILAANAADLSVCPDGDAVIIDRLKVNDVKIDAMIRSVESVAAQADPEGFVISSHVREDGLRIENRRVPFGTVLIIYEARPDVTIEAAAIAIKGGNRILLKGGKEARNTNLLLVELWHRALGTNTEVVRYLDLSRDETRSLIHGDREKFDLVIPRGGDGLIDFVLKNSSAPVIVSGRGNNFLYVDSEADLEMALRIAVDGKSRLSVCNALDKVLIDRVVPNIGHLVSDLVARFSAISVEVFGDAKVCSLNPGAIPIENDEIWDEEFLSAKIAIGVANGLDEAIDMINKHSGGHSATIVTSNAVKADEFMKRVDCAAVYHNASTRFTDGGELGLGAEIAISTQKLHFRGPLGAEHLMTNKWFVFGDGHVRN